MSHSVLHNDRQMISPQEMFLTGLKQHGIKSRDIMRLGWDKISLRQESQSAVIIYSFNKYLLNTFSVLDIESS